MNNYIISLLLLIGLLANNLNISAQTTHQAAIKAQAEKAMAHEKEIEEQEKQEEKIPQPPLLKAASQGNLQEVKRLIEQGVDVNTKNKNGKTALMKAAYKGHSDVVKYLIDKGANVHAKDAKDNFGLTPLHWTTFGQYQHTSWGTSEKLFNEPYDPIKYFDIVKSLADKGADLNAKNNDGNTPLEWAVIAGNFDIVKYLVDKGADVKNTKDVLGHPAMTLNLDLIKYLVARGANVNEQDENGKTPLHDAILGHDRGRDMAVIEYLVTKGADVNTQSKEGRTPLHDAAYWGDFEAIQYFVENGAKVHLKDNDGKTALDIAKAEAQDHSWDKKFSKAIKYLEQKMAEQQKAK